MLFRNRYKIDEVATTYEVRAGIDAALVENLALADALVGLLFYGAVGWS